MRNQKRRNQRITFRISENEQEIIRLEAAKAGLGMGEYCRHVLVGSEGNLKKREDTLRNMELALRLVDEKVENIQSEIAKSRTLDDF